MNYITVTDPLEAYFLTHRMQKQMRKFPKTEPFHTPRACKNRARCVWHERKN